MSILALKTKSEFLQNRPLVLQVVHSFFTSIFVAIFFSVATIEFVRNFEKSFLPIGYLFSGVIGYALIIIYGKFFDRLGQKAFYLPHVFMLASASFFWVAFLFIAPETLSSQVLSFSVYIFCTPFIYLASNQQAGLIIKKFNIRDSKKYSGVISSAGTLAFIVGYFSVPTLTKLLGSNLNLLWVAILGLLVGFLVLIKIVKSLNQTETFDVVTSKQPIKHQSYRELLSRKFILFIAISGGLSTIAYYFVDYSFLVNSQIAFKDNPQELASFIGYFLSLIKIFEFLLGVYSSYFFRKFGLKTGLIILPILCLLFVSLSILASFDESHVFLLAIFVFSLKFFERIFKKSIEEPAYKNLYQILDKDERLSILAKIEGGTKQISVILGSLILIVYGWITPQENIRLGILYISIVLFIVWVFYAFKLVEAFKAKIKQILEAKHIVQEEEKLLGWEKLLELYKKSGKNNSIAKAVNTYLGDRILAIDEADLLNLALKDDANLEYKTYQLSPPYFILPPKNDFITKYLLSSNNNPNKFELIEMALHEKGLSAEKLDFLSKKLNEAKLNFDKRLILNLIGRIRSNESWKKLLQLTNYPDYVIKIQSYYYLEHLHFKIGEQQVQHFWSNLEKVLGELTYLISILSSLQANKSYQELRNALQEEERILENRILSILTWKYDQASIVAIRRNLFSNDDDENLLALELFDNLLEIEIKEKILTIFNKSTNFDRLSVLNKWFYYPALKVEDAIVSLLNSDFTKIGNWTKVCAIKLVINEKNAAYIQIMKSYLFHPDLFLRSMSFKFFNKILNRNDNNRETVRIFEIIESKENNSLNDPFAAFELIKIMRNHELFSKVTSSELINLAYNARHEISNGECISNKESNSGAIFIIDSKIEIKCAVGYKLASSDHHYVGPQLFNADQIHCIIIPAGASFYSFNTKDLTDLITTSDKLLGSLLEGTGGFNFHKS